MPHQYSTQFTVFTAVLFFRVAKSYIVLNVAHLQQSPLINHQTKPSMLRSCYSTPRDAVRLQKTETLTPHLKSTPGNGSENGVEKCVDPFFISCAKNNSNGRNTFGTYDKLRPIHKQPLGVSTESLPPPPSPRTLRKVMTIR